MKNEMYIQRKRPTEILRMEAAAAGDNQAVRLCDLALGGDVTAEEAVHEMLSEAATAADKVEAKDWVWIPRAEYRRIQREVAEAKASAETAGGDFDEKSFFDAEVRAVTSLRS